MEKTLKTICYTVWVTLLTVSIIAKIKGIGNEFSEGLVYFAFDFFLLTFGVEFLYTPNKVSKTKRNIFIIASLICMIAGIYQLPDLIGANIFVVISILAALNAFPGLLYKEERQPNRSTR